jgi:predicted Zn-dependent peptidase
MGSRLFVEVREKRGLAYHVSAGYFGLREAAGLFTFAGTRPDTARETLEIMTDQLRMAGENISDDELERAKTQLRSSLVMEGQSSTSRAGAIVADWYILQKIRELDEISGRIDLVDRDAIGRYIAEYPARGLSLVTVGPEPVEYDFREM